LIGDNLESFNLLVLKFIPLIENKVPLENYVAIVCLGFQEMLFVLNVINTTQASIIIIAPSKAEIAGVILSDIKMISIKV